MDDFEDDHLDDIMFDDPPARPVTGDNSNR